MRPPLLFFPCPVAQHVHHVSSSCVPSAAAAGDCAAAGGAADGAGAPVQGHAAAAGAAGARHPEGDGQTGLQTEGGPTLSPALTQLSCLPLSEEFEEFEVLRDLKRCESLYDLLLEFMFLNLLLCIDLVG